MARKASRKKRGDTGYTFEQRMEDFAEEVQQLGEKFGEWVDGEAEWHRQQAQHISHVPEEPRPHFNGTFAVVGPLVSALVGLSLFMLVIWMMNFINAYVGSSLVMDLQIFLMANIGAFFLIFLFSSYNTYFSKAYPKGYSFLSPIATATGITLALWVLVSVIAIANSYIGVAVISAASLQIYDSLYTIFLVVLLIGYLVFLARGENKTKRD